MRTTRAPWSDKNIVASAAGAPVLRSRTVMPSSVLAMLPPAEKQNGASDRSVDRG